MNNVRDFEKMRSDMDWKGTNGTVAPSALKPDTTASEGSDAMRNVRDLDALPSGRDWNRGGDGLQALPPNTDPSEGSIAVKDLNRDYDRVHPNQDWSPKPKRKEGFAEIKPDTTPSNGASSMNNVRDFEKMRSDMDWKGTNGTVAPSALKPDTTASEGSNVMKSVRDFDHVQSDADWKSSYGTFSNVKRDISASRGSIALEPFRKFEAMPLDFDWKKTGSSVNVHEIKFDITPSMGSNAIANIRDLDNMRGDIDWKTGRAAYSEIGPVTDTQTMFRQRGSLLPDHPFWKGGLNSSNAPVDTTASNGAPAMLAPRSLDGLTRVKAGGADSALQSLDPDTVPSEHTENLRELLVIPADLDWKPVLHWEEDKPTFLLEPGTGAAFPPFEAPDFRPVAAPPNAPPFKVPTNTKAVPGLTPLGNLERDKYVDPKKRLEEFYARSMEGERCSGGTPNHPRYIEPMTPAGKKALTALNDRGNENDIEGSPRGRRSGTPSSRLQTRLRTPKGGPSLTTSGPTPVVRNSKMSANMVAFLAAQQTPKSSAKGKTASKLRHRVSSGTASSVSIESADSAVYPTRPQFNGCRIPSPHLRCGLPQAATKPLRSSLADMMSPINAAPPSLRSGQEHRQGTLTTTPVPVRSPDDKVVAGPATEEFIPAGLPMAGPNRARGSTNVLATPPRRLRDSNLEVAMPSDPESSGLGMEDSSGTSPSVVSSEDVQVHEVLSPVGGSTLLQVGNATTEERPVLKPVAENKHAPVDPLNPVTFEHHVARGSLPDNRVASAMHFLPTDVRPVRHKTMNSKASAGSSGVRIWGNHVLKHVEDPDPAFLVTGHRMSRKESTSSTMSTRSSRARAKRVHVI